MIYYPILKRVETEELTFLVSIWNIGKFVCLNSNLKFDVLLFSLSKILIFWLRIIHFLAFCMFSLFYQHCSTEIGFEFLRTEGILYRERQSCFKTEFLGSAWFTLQFSDFLLQMSFLSRVLFCEPQHLAYHKSASFLVLGLIQTFKANLCM